MRPSLALVTLVVVFGGCRIFSSALPCGDDDGCPPDAVCIDGLCAVGAGSEGEGEEGEGAEGEGEAGEGEGDAGEGEGDAGEGEGEGDLGEGEGEGDLGEGEGEGEGEGDLGEGEGEGEGEGDLGEGEGEGDPVDPCPPLFDEEFDGQNGLRVDTGPSSSAQIQFAGTGQMRLSTRAVAADQPGSFAIVTPLELRSFVGEVIELDLQLEQSVQAGESVGLSFAADDFPNDFDLNLDVVRNILAFYAIGEGPGPLQTVEGPFPGGTLLVQIRLDGPTPVAIVNGVAANLGAVSSATIRNHHLDLFAGCFEPPCNGVTLTVDRLRVFGACRP